MAATKHEPLRVRAHTQVNNVYPETYRGLDPRLHHHDGQGLPDPLRLSPKLLEHAKLYASGLKPLAPVLVHVSATIFSPCRSVRVAET